jgi:hypothetical protein
VIETLRATGLCTASLQSKRPAIQARHDSNSTAAQCHKFITHSGIRINGIAANPKPQRQN